MPSEFEISVIIHLDALRDNLKRQDKVLARLDYTIHGNGTPGLKTVVDRHERALKIIRRVAWVVLTPVLATVGGGILAAAMGWFHK